MVVNQLTKVFQKLSIIIFGLVFFSLGAACPFGSTTSRVLPLIKKDAFTMPSPAAYQDSDLPCFTKSKLSHTFSSDNKRFPLLQSMIKVISDIMFPVLYSTLETCLFKGRSCNHDTPY